MHRLRTLVLLWLPVVAWMTAIYLFSADPESGPRGSRILVPVIRWFYPEISQPTLDQTVLLIRKGAHFGSYAILALLLYRALPRVAGGGWSRPTAIAAWIGSVLYAISDEIHQSFVPSRTASAFDVVIDGLGAATALALLYAVCAWRRRISRHEPADGIGHGPVRPGNTPR